LFDVAVDTELGEETELQIIVVWSIKTTLWKILE
jgi:hypothetical protein